jgi:hypothetical protein
MRKIFLLALGITLILGSVNSTPQKNGRVLANSEQDKPISLTKKQWAIIGGGSLAIFVVTYLLLGMCCATEIKTREASSTLTTGLAANEEDNEVPDSERALDDSVD